MAIFTTSPSVTKWVYLFLLPCLLSFYTPAFGQVNISGVINRYAAVTDPNACTNKLTVSTTAGFQVNGKVLVIQMQGAAINESNSSSFGNVENINGAGLYEKATIAAINTNELTFYNDLINIYDYNSSVQVVTIPQYTNTVVSGTITAQPWNGSTGGIIAFEASGTIILNADINANGVGFRGGAITPNINSLCNPSSNSTLYAYNSTDTERNWESAFKGEGIAKVTPGYELGKGPQANGGGGGNDHNTGGGGGAHPNASSGGKGGNNVRYPTFSLEYFTRCYGENAGLGGKRISATLNDRLYMGGGGGGGHSNDTEGNVIAGTPGANGGGIIYISANEFNGNGRVVSANGNSALNGLGDGVGGGGAGGTILLQVNNFAPDDFNVQANGGNGASVDNQRILSRPASDDRCFGPGGGGGGGLVAVEGEKFPDEVIKSVSGGQPGFTLNSRRCTGTNGAVTGSAGVILNDVIMPESTTAATGSCSPLPVDFFSFTAEMQSDKVLLEWITASETNNDYFAIECSQDGVHFNETGRIMGKGTVAVFTTYQFTDAHPFAGISYYRLRQVDIDGKFDYSKTISMDNKASLFSVSLYPNPGQEKKTTFLQIVAPQAETAQIQVTTLLGETVFTHTQALQPGTTVIELPSERFAAGVYLVQVRSGNILKTIKWQVL